MMMIMPACHLMFQIWRNIAGFNSQICKLHFVFQHVHVFRKANAHNLLESTNQPLHVQGLIRSMGQGNRRCGVKRLRRCAICMEKYPISGA
jgi:hypothetical protein